MKLAGPNQSSDWLPDRIARLWELWRLWWTRAQATQDAWEWRRCLDIAAAHRQEAEALARSRPTREEFARGVGRGSCIRTRWERRMDDRVIPF